MTASLPLDKRPAVVSVPSYRSRAPETAEPTGILSPGGSLCLFSGRLPENAENQSQELPQNRTELNGREPNLLVASGSLGISAYFRVYPRLKWFLRQLLLILVQMPDKAFTPRISPLPSGEGRG
jgi:hypothetical protein